MTPRLGLATRDAYGQALLELGREDPRVVVLDADLSVSTKTNLFAKEFPDRFLNVGIAEANLVGLAGGLAHSGKIPFISSFACFMICKGYDQLRMAVAVPRANVKVVASHGGISVGEDGASQQSVEDIALAASLPGFTVIVPADEHATRALVKAAARMNGPVYLRTGRPKAPLVYEADSSFAIGKGVLLREGKDVTLAANGLLVGAALAAAEALAADGISAAVVDLHTVKPLDEELIERQAKATGAIVTAEEHQVWGGLGAAVSQAVARRHPVPMEFVAIQDTYAESGKPEELMEKYGLTASGIVQAARRVLKRKRDPSLRSG
ncbi:MAG: transketolase family protein [Candidatus Omnitrophica bacterium]|nr:transketolase family protein [Candidatus Omnitrophota bacterium]